jgi:hypothetical protein
MASCGIAVAQFILFLVVLSCPALLPGAGAAEPTRVLEDPPGQGFLHPCDIEADGQGVLFILDCGRRSVFVYSSDGKFIRDISGKGNWKDPQGIALMPDRAVLLADGDAGRVIEMDLAGTVRREYSLGKGARATDAAFYGDLVYCVDNRNAKILVFRRNGEKVGGWGKQGEAPSEFSSPFRLAIDPSGRVFITDVMNSRIQWFSPHGQLLGTIRAFGIGRGKLLRPSTVAVDGMGGVWVGDSYSGVVQQFDDKGNARKVLQSDKGTPEIYGDPSGIAKVPGGIWVADQRKKRVSFRKQ